jgi:hypothetical protein
MNDAHRHAHKAVELVKNALEDNDLSRPSAQIFTTVCVAAFGSQSDLDFFKVAWSLQDYQEAVAEFVRLAKDQGWYLATNVAMTRQGFETGPFATKFDYILGTLGINDGNSRDESLFGLRPMVLLCQPASSRSILKSEKKFPVY